MFFNIGTPELLVILVIALIVVGPRRLPEIGRQVGRAMAELRKVQDEVRDMVRFDLSEDTPSEPDTKPVLNPHVYREIDDEEVTPEVDPLGLSSDSVPDPAKDEPPAPAPFEASE